MPVYRVLPERLRVLSLQAERPLTPSIPLLIRGFGVRVPGGAPAKTYHPDGGLSGLPGSATWPPARYRPPVFVVPRAEPALQLRLLQPVDPGDQRERDETRVPQQVWPPQQNRLAEDRGVEREVYGVAHVPVQAADNEMGGRCDGCRGTEPFDHEPGERGHQYGGPGHHQYGTEYPKRYEVGQWRTRVPVGDQPRNEPDDGTRGKDEEDRASGRGSGALHGCHPFAARGGRMVGALRPVDRGLQRRAVEAAGGQGGR